MSDTVTQEVQTPAAHAGLVHVATTCCPPHDWSLCGMDISGQDYVSDDTTTTCIVCDDVERATDCYPCPRCGELLEG